MRCVCVCNLRTCSNHQKRPFTTKFAHYSSTFPVHTVKCLVQYYHMAFHFLQRCLMYRRLHIQPYLWLVFHQESVESFRGKNWKQLRCGTALSPFFYMVHLNFEKCCCQGIPVNTEINGFVTTAALQNELQQAYLYMKITLSGKLSYRFILRYLVMLATRYNTRDGWCKKFRNFHNNVKWCGKIFNGATRSTGKRKSYNEEPLNTFLGARWSSSASSLSSSCRIFACCRFWWF